jgi:hypothetical protein
MDCISICASHDSSSDGALFPRQAATTMRHLFISGRAPNQSPEPTAVGAGRSAVAVHAASRRWLSFFR